MSEIYEQLKSRSLRLWENHDLLGKEIRIKARVLSTEEAIGNPESDDFPLQKGKERLMQAEFEHASGQAFTDRFGDFEGTLEEISQMALNNNFRRAIFVAALNAVGRHLNLIDGTIHCRNQEPAECAEALAAYIEDRYGRMKITQVGFQPRMVESMAARFSLRVLDLDPDNIGTSKYGAPIEGPETAPEAVQWADLLVVTGTTLVNGTIDQFLTSKPVLFYGTTIAGAANLMKWDRFCAKSK